MILSLDKPLKSVRTQLTSAFFKIRYIWIVLLIIGLGVLLGYLNSSSQATAELTVSILVVLVLLLITIPKPLNGLLLLFVLMPFIEQYVEIPLGAGIPDLSFSRFILAFLAVFMLAQAAIGKFQFATPITLAEVCIVAATIGIMSAAPMDVKPERAVLLTINRRFIPLAMYFFARNLVKNKADLHKLFTTFVILGVAISLYAIYEHTTQNVLFVSKETEIDALRTSYRSGLYLIRGLLGRANNFGRVLISTIPITFYLFFENKSINRKILLAIALVIEFYALFITYNRTSWYALMITLFLLQLFYPQFRKFYFILVMVTVTVLWLTWDQVVESEVVEGRLNDRSEDFNGRSERWRVAYEMWQAKPIRGWGIEAYSQQSGRFRTDGSRQNFGGMENDYLFLMVSSGLIGFVPYLIFLIAPLINSVRLFFRSRAPDWSGFIKPETVAVYWCVVTAFAIGSYSQVLSQPLIMMIPFALAGAVVGTHHRWLLGSEVKQRSVQEWSSVASVTG